MNNSDSKDIYDVVVIGGGIHGCMALLEASRRGLRSLLLERGELGSGVTANNFRTLHGGLRSLQSADIAKFFESVSERRWFLQHFPEHTSVNRFVLPLNGKGAHRTSIMRLAGLANDVLSGYRNHGVNASHHIPQAGICRLDRYQSEFPLVKLNKVIPTSAEHGFYWFDGHLDEVSALLDSIIHWAESLGGRSQTHQLVSDLGPSEDSTNLEIRSNGAHTNSTQTVRAKVVIDTAAQWHNAWDQYYPPVTDSKAHYPSLAWNLVFDLPAISSDSIAYRTDDAINFIRNLDGQLAVGTGHAPLPDDVGTQASGDLAERHIDKFIDQLNNATGLNLHSDQIDEVLAGRLPVSEPRGTTLAVRPSVNTALAQRLYRVSGVKFTTARSVMSQILDRICRQHFPGAKPKPYQRA